MDRIPAALLALLIFVFALATTVQIARSQEAGSAVDATGTKEEARSAVGATGTKEEEGIASVYGAESGHRRADGHPFRPAEIGCAHRTRRLGSVVRVTLIATGRSILCPINDRGPAEWTHRILDLSTGAARALGVIGLARVRID